MSQLQASVAPKESIGRVCCLYQDDLTILFANDYLDSTIVPEVQKVPQSSTICIYCCNKEAAEQNNQPLDKIKAVCNKLDELLNTIRVDSKYRVRVEESLVLYILDRIKMDLNGQFLHSQMLVDVLIHMKSNEYEKRNLIEFCMNEYKHNESSMKLVKKFDAEYQCKEAIWWYTHKSFLSDILNKALHEQNVDVVFLFHNIIQDIFEQLRANQCEERIKVYRRQILSTKEFKQLKNSIGSFVSINSFLLTTLDRRTALSFNESTICSLACDNLVPVIFEIDADPYILKNISDNSRPFSKMTKLINQHEGFEVLFMLGSIFLLKEIVFNDDMSVKKSKMPIVRMVWRSAYDTDFKQFYDHIKNEYEEQELNLLSLGHLAYKIGNFNLVETYYRRSLHEISSDDLCLSAIYHNLGMVAGAKSEYDKSLQWYQKSIEVLINICPVDYARLSVTHNSIGNVYRNKGEPNRALEYYNRAVTLFEQANDENHPYIASFYNNIGIIYYDSKEYLEALKFYKKSLAIKKRKLTVNHSSLSGLYDNIGLVQQCLGQYEQALKSYNRSLEIRRKSLPFQHADIAMTYKNMGVVYEEKGDFKQALVLFQEALTIYEALWPTCHTNIPQMKDFIERLQNKMKNSKEDKKSKASTYENDFF